MVYSVAKVANKHMKMYEILANTQMTKWVSYHFPPDWTHKADFTSHFKKIWFRHQIKHTTKTFWEQKSCEKACCHHHWLLQEYQFPWVAATYLGGIFLEIPAKIWEYRATDWVWSPRSASHSLPTHCIFSRYKCSKKKKFQPGMLILLLILYGWQTCCKLINCFFRKVIDFSRDMTDCSLIQLPIYLWTYLFRTGLLT